MKNRKSIISLFLCFSTVLCAFSMSSFAVLFPFSSDYGTAENTVSEMTNTTADEIEAAESSVFETASVSTKKNSESTADTEFEYIEKSVEENTDSLIEIETEGTEEADRASSVTEKSEEATQEGNIPYEVLNASYSAVKSVAGVQTVGKATAIETDSETEGSLNLVSSVNDYTFTLSSRGVLSYTVSHTKTDDLSGWKVYLYQKYFANGFDGEEKWRLINVLETDSTVSRDSSPNIGLQKGSYRISVTSGTKFTGSVYTLGVNFTPGYDYEIECNNTLSRYTEIFPNVPVKGSACWLIDEYDCDYYMFRVYTTGKTGIKFEHPKIESSISVYWRVSLYNSDGQEIYSENSSSTDTVLESGDLGLEPGCYYISVANRVYTDTDYTLTLTRSVTDSYETELNNTVATADKLPLNKSINGAIVSTSEGNDKDVFALTLTESGTVKLEFTVPGGTETDYSHHILLTDAPGRSIWEGRVSPKNNTLSSAVIGLEAGTYYITVDCTGLHGNNSTYTVKNTFTAAADWETEYNGSAEFANPLSDNTGVYGTAVNCETDYDDDWFMLKLEKDSRVRVSLKHGKISGKKNIFTVCLLNESTEAVNLEDADGGLLTSSDGAGITEIMSNQNDEEVCGYYTLPAGEYYIRVSSGLFATDAQYLLTYTAVQ